MSDRRERLESARDLLLASMQSVDPDKVAPLAKEYRLLLGELDSLPDEAKVSDADEIAARRAARRASSSRSPRAKRSG